MVLDWEGSWTETTYGMSAGEVGRMVIAPALVRFFWMARATPAFGYVPSSAGGSFSQRKPHIQAGRVLVLFYVYRLGTGSWFP